MTTVAFTGLSSLDDDLPTFDIVPFIDNIVARIEADQFVSGGSWGVDTLVAVSAHQQHPEARHTLVLPAAPFNDHVARYARVNGFEIIRCEVGRDDPDSYMRRNDKLVELADVLYAFPLTEVEFRRSGTWATIRRARKKGIPIHINALGC